MLLGRGERRSLSLDPQGSEEEVVLKFVKRIVKITVQAGRMNGENRNEVP